MDGIINIYKESGYTSFDVVARLRGILKQKKIGHTGTLDPMAEGVLLVCLGKATKLVDLMTAKDKEYRATVLLGIETDTEDITGNVIKKGDYDNVDDETIRQAIKEYIGTYMQIPPMYSAIKKDGRKLYEYAREGIEIERTPREVTIYSIDNIRINIPEIQFDVRCSKGTYIRSLCRDIGRKIGSYATLKALNRTEVNGYFAEDALTLDEVCCLKKKGQLEDKIIAIDEILVKFASAVVKQESKKQLMNGNILKRSAFKDELKCFDAELIRVYCEDDFIALYQYNSKDNIFKPYKMFI